MLGTGSLWLQAADWASCSVAQVGVCGGGHSSRSKGGSVSTEYFLKIVSTVQNMNVPGGCGHRGQASCPPRPQIMAAQSEAGGGGAAMGGLAGVSRRKHSESVSFCVHLERRVT